MLDFVLKPMIQSGIKKLKDLIGKADFNKDGKADFEQISKALDHLESVLLRASKAITVENLLKAGALLQQAAALLQAAVKTEEMQALLVEVKPTLLLLKNIALGALQSAKAAHIASAEVGEKEVDVA